MLDSKNLLKNLSGIKRGIVTKSFSRLLLTDITDSTNKLVSVCNCSIVEGSRERD